MTGVNVVRVNAGQLELISRCSDFKIKKGSRIYEEDNRYSMHEEKNTEILDKPGVYWQEVSSGDPTEI